MKQSKINNWFKPKNNKAKTILEETSKTQNKFFSLINEWYFNCDFENDSTSLTFEKIKDSITISSVVVDKININLCYVGKWENEEESFLENKPKINYTNVPLMKSLLQKAVRRCNNEIALKASWNLIVMDVNAFLRRLPIIIIEDVVPINNFSLIVWLMMVQGKGINILNRHLQYCLGLIDMLCSIKTHFRYKSTNEILFDKTEIFKNDNPEFLFSLFARKAYGGMKGDMIMINNLINKTYYERLTFENYKINLIKLNIPTLELNEWILAAVDFHVCSIAKKLANLKKANEENVKILIWNNSSKLNFRCGKYKINYEWNNYESDFNRLAEWWINNLS